MLWLVRLSQVGVLSKWQNESRWVFGTGTSTNPAMCRVKIRLSRKIKVLLPGTSSQTRDLENFVTRRVETWCRQQNLSTVELVDSTCDGRRIVAARTWPIACTSVYTGLFIMVNEAEADLPDQWLKCLGTPRSGVSASPIIGK